MSKKKSLALIIGGALLFDYASIKLGYPGLKDLGIDMYNSAVHSPFGSVLDTVVKYLDHYAKDFFFDKHAALGTVGQAGMYGGLGGLVYDLFKKKPKITKEKKE